VHILVLGGTLFIGRHVVERLLADGHSVTLLNRGVTNPGVFEHLPRLQVDRHEPGALERLSGLRADWDAAIDLSGYFPDDVRRLLSILRGRCGRYVFCSTLSVYQASSSDEPIAMLTESDPLLPCTAEQAVDPSPNSYGERKAECERVAMEQHASGGGVPVVVLRPSVVFGAHDPTDRMAYWIARAKNARPFILPDGGLTITRRTYAPDLAAAFAASVTSSEAPGNAYNIAETDPLNFRQTVASLGEHFGTDPLSQAIGISGVLLISRKVRQWVDFPLWLSGRNLLTDTFAARRDLKVRSTPPGIALAEAAKAFVAQGREPKAGLSFEAEAKLIADFNRA
jgi:2'-hydroxyisoflavone reductase